MTEESIWLNVEKMREISQRAGRQSHALVLAMDLMACVYMPAKQAFLFDPTSLAAAIMHLHPKRDRASLPNLIATERENLKLFFVELPDGRWAPNPDLFSVVNPNAEQV